MAAAPNDPTSIFRVPPLLAGRLAITEVSPSVLSGRRPAAAVVDEAVRVRVTCFREGHDTLGVAAVLHHPDGSEYSRVSLNPDGIDSWAGIIRPNEIGHWMFTIEAWGDPWRTWLQRANIKIPADLDIELEFAEGALLLDQALAFDLPAANKSLLMSATTAMRNTSLPPSVRLAAAVDPQVATAITENPIREQLTTSGPWPLNVQRRRALFGAWYEFFPRSEGALLDPPTSGTFPSAAKRLAPIADMGFDVVYLPPVHPIGFTDRKGPNNTLIASDSDPGSPWAIGSDAGGHDAIHPDLGTIKDFDDFVAVTTALGMEIALDLALQASPDHPWVKTHPQWFTTRADGSIAYAENPPKKYQDIYPLNFDNDPEGLYVEIERIVRFWMSHGVRIFRVDNPHTKPIWLWDRLIASINADNPDVIFLAEAFTSRPMMQALAEVGFQQSYTYFTWRNSKQELEEYGNEIAGPAAAYMRPNFFTNTPDILHSYLQHGGPGAFAIRAVLASTLSPAYGIYSGFELFEHVALQPGSEEYLDTEKFQYRPRDWDAAIKQGRSLAPLLTLINKIRREHKALQDLRSLYFHQCDNPNIIAFSKQDGDDTVLVVCTLDPHHTQEATVWWNLAAIGLDPQSLFIAHDLLTDTTWTWGQSTYVRLTPWEQVAHIVHVRH
jgi:starch synthase (maltosyl-transferring)